MYRDTEVKGFMRFAILLIATLLLPGLIPAAAHAETSAPIDIVYLALAIPHTYPETTLDAPPGDLGVQGARLGVADDATTGRFTHQTYRFTEVLEGNEAAVLQAFKDAVRAGKRLFVTDLPAPLLLKVADLPEAKDSLIIDAVDPDDALRGADCRANVLHVMPSRAMLADALMQYLVVKDWRRVMLVVGQDPADKLYADAVRRSAKKFQIRITTDRPWTFNPAAQQADTGHFEINTEVAKLTQGTSYDVLIVADEADAFGDELGYRTTDPRPVGGTQGLVPSAWAKPFDEYGATQLQARFLRQAHRWMTDQDYGAWLATRAIGEAATRAASTDPKTIATYMRGNEFELAGFKGMGMSFRPWDGQLRQPVLLADARSLVSISPQPGFLHQFNELDTLGLDQPETQCHTH
jgi:ABC transporter substrate binding protein (PQQ-dependent alcohol dehydrogenase system)